MSQRSAWPGIGCRSFGSSVTEVLHQRLEDVVLRDALDDVRVQLLWVGLVPLVEHLLDVADAYASRRLAAPGDESRDTKTD
jgi:hypothetical protein